MSKEHAGQQPNSVQKRRGRKPEPSSGVWTAEEMAISENWQFSEVPDVELNQALEHELKREVIRMHQASQFREPRGRIRALLEKFDSDDEPLPYLKTASPPCRQANEMIRPILQPEALKPSAALWLPKEPLPVIGQGSLHVEPSFQYPMNTFTSRHTGTGVLVMVDVAAVRRAILDGKEQDVLLSLCGACGLPKSWKKLASRNPHQPWLSKLPDDDMRLDPRTLLFTLGYARLRSSGMPNQTAWSKVGFLEKWGKETTPESFIRLESRRLTALRLNLKGMRVWMFDPARTAIRKPS